MIETHQEPMPVETAPLPCRTIFRVLLPLDPNTIEDQIDRFAYQVAADSDWGHALADDPANWIHRELLERGIDTADYQVTTQRHGPGTRGPHRFCGEGHVNHQKRIVTFTIDRLVDDRA